MSGWQDLPKDCALLACATCYMLARYGITCRPLAITYQPRPRRRHVIVIFQFEGRLRGYDRGGSVTLPAKLSFDDPPTKIARAWASSPDNEWDFTAVRGEWY